MNVYTRERALCPRPALGLGLQVRRPCVAVSSAKVIAPRTPLDSGTSSAAITTALPAPRALARRISREAARRGDVWDAYMTLQAPAPPHHASPRRTRGAIYRTLPHGAAAPAAQPCVRVAYPPG